MSTQHTPSWDPPDDELPPPAPGDSEDSGYGSGRIIRHHAHNHDTGHDSSTPVSAHTRRMVLAILIPLIVLTAVGMILLWPGAFTQPRDQASAQPGGQRAYGDVVLVTLRGCPEPAVPGSNQPCSSVDVHLTGGPGSGTTISVSLPRGPGAPVPAVGDQVVLSFTPNAAAGEPAFAIIDEQRGQPMIYLLALCGAIIVLFGRWRGLTAIVGLVVSFAVLLLFVIPAILNGESPVLVAIVGAAAITFAMLYLIHGVTVRTSVAVLATLVALALTGLLGAVFTAATKLTGLSSDGTVSAIAGNVDMRGLLLAGIIIGSLGVLGDLTVTQAATVGELSGNATSRWQVFRVASRLGRAHLASAVNTIVLAYAGVGLPLLLVIAVGGNDLSDLLTSQFLAEEIVRTAVGVIGLVAAVPITTALAALVADIRPASAHRAGAN